MSEKDENLVNGDINETTESKQIIVDKDFILKNVGENSFV